MSGGLVAAFPDRADAASGRLALVRATARIQASAPGAWALVSLVRRQGWRRVVHLVLLTGRDAADLRRGLAFEAADGVLDLWIEAVSRGVDRREVLDEA